MNKKGTWTFILKNLTRKALGKNIALVLDDLVYAATKVNDVISNGHSQFSVNFHMDQDLVNILNSVTCKNANYYIRNDSPVAME
jgi:SecD/SecF fusion protein